MSHIFISYSHKDAAYAHALAKYLQDMGFSVWIDERLDYGSQWPQEIQTQLDSCDAFIIIMSSRSYVSDWVQSELQRAKRKVKPIFPLLLEGDEPWLSVESTQFFDVRGGVLPDSRFASALKRVVVFDKDDRTFKVSNSPVKPRSVSNSSAPKSRKGLVIAGLGILLIFCVGCATLFTGSFLGIWMNQTPPVLQSTPEQILSKEITTIPSPTLPAPMTLTPQITLPSQIAVINNSDMALVPAGKFKMGRKAIDELPDCQKFNPGCQVAWFTDEEPVHEVNLDAFYIDKYEVTNALYKTCVDQGVCVPPSSSNSNTRINYYGNPEFDQYPVIYVNWNQAKAYCEWRKARLPTEAEWEKAARGTDGRIYPWGDKLDKTFANFHYSIGDTTAVGSYENGKSPYGVYDMAGNVWEWVNSQHEPYPYTASDGREDSDGDGLRVLRGGSWGYQGDNSVSTSFRFGANPTDSNMDIGFRCANNATP